MVCCGGWADVIREFARRRPGMSAAIVESGRVVLARGFGSTGVAQGIETPPVAMAFLDALRR